MVLLIKRLLMKHCFDIVTFVSTLAATLMVLSENYRLLQGNRCSDVPTTIPTKLNDIVSYDRRNHAIFRKECLVKGTLRKNYSFLVVGIPTMMRQYKNKTAFYLERTLNAFLKPLKREEKESMQFLLFLTDLNPQKRKKIISRLENKYRKELWDGLINIIEIPKRYYRNLKNLPQTLGDSPSRVYWRSKQSLDYAFIFRYARNLGEFYMQTEDDALPRKDYLHVIRRDIRLGTSISINGNLKLPWGHKEASWLSLHYYPTGFIGVVIQTYNLDMAAIMAQTFYWNVPVDELFRHLHTWTLMYQMETLFTHIGNQSSRLSFI